MITDGLTEVLTGAAYPARITCNLCPVTTTVIDPDEGTRWLAGHIGAFHQEGPIEFGVWSGVQALRYDPEFVQQTAREVHW